MRSSCCIKMSAFARTYASNFDSTGAWFRRILVRARRTVAGLTRHALVTAHVLNSSTAWFSRIAAAHWVRVLTGALFSMRAVMTGRRTGDSAALTGVGLDFISILLLHTRSDDSAGAPARVAGLSRGDRGTARIPFSAPSPERRLRCPRLPSPCAAFRADTARSSAVRGNRIRSSRRRLPASPNGARSTH
jgi:hypothetical protein